MDELESISTLAEEAAKPDFSTEAKDVLKALGDSSGKIEFVGTGTADFQAQPFVYGPDGQPIIVSDWELHTKREVDAGRQNAGDFPHFLEQTDLYVKRAEELGLSMYRFSLDFARLCPSEQEFNDTLMGEYVKKLNLNLKI